MDQLVDCGRECREPLVTKGSMCPYLAAPEEASPYRASWGGLWANTAMRKWALGCHHWLTCHGWLRPAQSATPHLIHSYTHLYWWRTSRLNCHAQDYRYLSHAITTALAEATSLSWDEWSRGYHLHSLSSPSNLLAAFWRATILYACVCVCVCVCVCTFVHTCRYVQKEVNTLVTEFVRPRPQAVCTYFTLESLVFSHVI